MGKQTKKPPFRPIAAMIAAASTAAAVSAVFLFPAIAGADYTEGTDRLCRARHEGTYVMTVRDMTKDSHCDAVDVGDYDWITMGLEDNKYCKRFANNHYGKDSNICDRMEHGKVYLVTTIRDEIDGDKDFTEVD